MRIAGFIPSRFGSQRFPGKPLALIHGKPMIQWVYENAKKCTMLDELWVATDNQEIYDTVVGFGGDAIITMEEHPSGTDRCLEAYVKSGSTCDVVVNIQGDEPFIKPEMIESLVKLFDRPEVELATLIKKIDSVDILLNPNKVKVTISSEGKVLYFSRSPIPFCNGELAHNWVQLHAYYKHIGIYGYRADILREICHMLPSTLEQCESLEQLRWLENGKSIFAAITKFESPAVDTLEDLRAIEKTYTP